AHLREFVGRRGAEPLRRAVRANERGEARLDRGVALAERVVVSVRDRRRVVLVVGDVVLRDLGGEALELCRGVALAEPVDGERGALDDLRAPGGFRALGPRGPSGLRLAAHCGAGVNVNLPS